MHECFESTPKGTLHLDGKLPPTQTKVVVINVRARVSISDDVCKIWKTLDHVFLSSKKQTVCKRNIYSSADKRL